MPSVIGSVNHCINCSVTKFPTKLMRMKFLASKEILLDSLRLRELLPSFRLYKNEVANPQGRTSADTVLRFSTARDRTLLFSWNYWDQGYLSTKQRFPAQLSHVSKTSEGLCLIPAHLQPNINDTPTTPEERTYWLLHLGLWSTENSKTFKNLEHWSHPFFSVWFFCCQSTWKLDLNWACSVVKIMIFEIKPLIPHFISATDFNIFERWEYIKCLPFNFVQSSSKITMIEEILYYIGPVPTLVI